MFDIYFSGHGFLSIFIRSGPVKDAKYVDVFSAPVDNDRLFMYFLSWSVLVISDGKINLLDL